MIISAILNRDIILVGSPLYNFFYSLAAQQQHLQQQQHMSTSYGQGQPTNYSQSRAFNSGTESYQTS